MMVFKVTRTVIFIIGMLGLMLYLAMKGVLDRETFLITGTVIFAAFLLSKGERKVIDFDDARLLALRKAQIMQKSGEIEAGELTLLNDTEMKSILLNIKNIPEVKPYRWDVGVKNEQTSNAWLFKITIFGVLYSCSEIKSPETYSVTETPEILDAGGKTTIDDAVNQEKIEEERRDAEERRGRRE